MKLENRIVAMTYGKPKICRNCGTPGSGRTHTKGHLLIEITLWLCFIIPGMIYSLWRHSSRSKVCRACGSANLVPIDSPAGQKLLTEYAKQP